MRIWITGCAGFLGSRLALAFVCAGHQVVGLSRRPCPSASRSVSIDLAWEGSRQRLLELGEDPGPPDGVVHAASLQPGPHTFSEYLRSNVLATANLLEALDLWPPRQLVYTSTLSVGCLPVLKALQESAPARGNYPYILTKGWGEQLVEAFQHRTQVIVLRLPSLYGAGQADSFVDGLARLALQDQVIELFSRGETVREALHVDDAVAAIQSCVATPPGERFCRMDLGYGRRVTTLEYVQTLVKALGSRSTIVPVDRPSSQQGDLHADIGEACRHIGFSPTPLSASMERYARELRAQS
jgi:nucleoside-diphosphate-sugar epimerase